MCWLSYPLHSGTRKREQWAKGSQEPSRGFREAAWRLGSVPWQLTAQKRSWVCFLKDLLTRGDVFLRQLWYLGVWDFSLFTFFFDFVIFSSFDQTKTPKQRKLIHKLQLLKCKVKTFILLMVLSTCTYRTSTFYKHFPCSTGYVLVLTTILASLSLIKGDTLCIFLTYCYKGKCLIIFGISQLDHSCEESGVWLWHICFPAFLHPVFLTTSRLFPEKQELRTNVTLTHWEVCFLQVWRWRTEIIGERGLWWLFAGCWTCFSKAFF